jgi:hypothetical protein
MDQKDTQSKIKIICEQLSNFLIEKNKRYGDSALSPIHIFNKDNANNSILIRLDDKLNRIKNNPILQRNDVIDLAGYLVLLMADHSWLDFKDLLD